MVGHGLAAEDPPARNRLASTSIFVRRLSGSLSSEARIRFRRSATRRSFALVLLTCPFALMLLGSAALGYRVVPVASRAAEWYLAIHFALLFVLGLAVVIVIGFLFRAHTLLRRQMEFVANVSHDLRTPLSIIASAADNLAEGVVRSDHSVKEYGALIRSECRRLSETVEQTLRFSAEKAEYRIRSIRFIRVPDVIDEILEEAATTISAKGFHVERHIDPNLPPVRTDVRSLSECLANLINNALKYGGDRRWMGIYARPVETGRGTGIQITVEDRGEGIEPDELAYIFEPFYRGRNARCAQICGTGLGLSLARESAISIGARITVQSTRGQGSAFTIHLPAAYMNSSTIPVEALVES